MKTVYLVTLNDNTQASIVKDVLQNEGIEVFTKNEILSTVLNIPGFQIELEVDEKDYTPTKKKTNYIKKLIYL